MFNPLIEQQSLILRHFLPQSLSLILLLLSAVGMIATLWLIPRNSGPGTRDLKAIIYTAAWWSACALAENLPIPPEARLFFGNLAWFGIAAIPFAVCQLLWTATHGRHRLIPPFLRRVSWVFILGTGAVAFSNPHRLMYREVIPAVANDGPLRYIHGPLFFAIILVLYAVLLATIAVTLWQQRRRPPRQRRNHLGLIVAVLAPILASAAYASGNLLFLSYDPSPFTFLLTAPILMWLLRRAGLCDPLPIARRALMGLLVDAIVVVDAEDYIVTCNPAADALPGFSDDACGRQWQSLPIWRDVIMRAIAAPGSAVSFHLPGDPPAYFDVTATPLSDDATHVGYLLLFRNVTHYRVVEERLREALAQLTEQLEENLSLQETLKAQAFRDPLTNLYNRRALDGFLPRLLSETGATGQSVSALMIDIDYFKSINDRFGHTIGDTILQLFGMRLSSMIRKSDLAFRMGGEEFLVLMPYTALAEAIPIAERWLQAFRVGFDASGEQIALTLSAGLATTSAPHALPDRLIDNADAATYHSKNNGRDQLSAYTAAGPLRV